MAEIFNCSWAEGTDILNTGATTEDVWDDSSNTGGYFSRVTSDGICSESHCLKWDGAPTGRYIKEIITQGTIGLRFAYKLTAESLGSGSSYNIFQLRLSGGTVVIAVYVKDTGSGHEIWAGVEDSGSTFRAISGVSISLNTWYQIEVIFKKNTAGNADLDLTGFGLKVWNAAGDSLQGSSSLGSAYTTYNDDIGQIYLIKVVYGNSTMYWDVVKADDAGWVGPQVCSSSFEELAGSISGGSFLSASLKPLIGMSGSLSGQSSLTALIGLIRPFSAILPVQSNLSGALKPIIGLGGSASAQSDSSALLGLTRPLSGDLSTQSNLSGDLSLSGLTELAGIISSISSLSGALDIQAALSGPIDAETGLTGSLEGLLDLSGSMDGQSALIGQISPYRGLSGGIDGSSQLSATLDPIFALSGSIGGQAVLSGLLNLLSELSGSIDAQSYLTGSLGSRIVEIILDPSIESLTKIRLVQSLTVSRTIEKI